MRTVGSIVRVERVDLAGYFTFCTFVYEEQYSLSTALISNQVGDMNDTELEWCQKHLRILSGMVLHFIVYLLIPHDLTKSVLT